jgi:Skp family chaperone for outer membrane proteins
MKPLLVKTLIVGCLMGLVSVGVAQNENKKKKGGGNDPVAQLKKKLAESDIGADLKEKIGKIIDENAGKLKELQAKVDSILTDDQKAARKAAQKAAKDAGKKGKQAADEVTAALKLTDEQKTKMEEAQSALNAARTEMNKAINALLTDEQIQTLGTKVGGKKKKNN